VSIDRKLQDDDRFECLGFALAEITMPITDEDAGAEIAAVMMQAMSPEKFPYLVEVAAEVVMVDGYEIGAQFDEGLELVLEGLERRL